MNDLALSFWVRMSWVLGGIFGVICGLAVAAGARIGQFIAMTERHRTVTIGLTFLAIFLGLCVAAFYFAYYLFIILGAH